MVFDNKRDFQRFFTVGRALLHKRTNEKDRRSGKNLNERIISRPSKYGFMYKGCLKNFVWIGLNSRSTSWLVVSSVGRCHCRSLVTIRLDFTMENDASTASAPKVSGRVAGWIESALITTSRTSLGQALFKFIDSFLWIVEKSAQWSLPAQEVAAEENGKVFGRIELVRPLPWIIFLPGLIVLRIIRGGLNLGAFILGYPQIQPMTMVQFMQKSRRRLRAIHLKGVKATRRQRCTRASTPDEKSTTESAASPTCADMKRKYSQVSLDEEVTDESEDETLQSKIERLAMDNSSDDPDFNPAECSTESSTTSSENEVDKEVSINELVDVTKQADELFQDGGEEPLIMSHETLKTNTTKTKDTAEGAKHLDSSEDKLSTMSKATADFINGEIKSREVELPVSDSTTASKSVPEVINGLVSEKQTSKEERVPSLNPPAFVPRENTWHHSERRGQRYKKGVRRDYK